MGLVDCQPVNPLPGGWMLQRSAVKTPSWLMTELGSSVPEIQRQLAVILTSLVMMLVPRLHWRASPEDGSDRRSSATSCQVDFE